MSPALPSPQLEDVRAVARLGVAGLRRVAGCVNVALASQPLTLVRELSDRADVSRDVAEAFVRLTTALAGWMSEDDEASEEVLESMTEALSASDQWSEEDAALWAEVSGELAEIAGRRTFRRLSEAFDLSIEHQHLWQEARIVTDIRPLYAEKQTEMDGALVSQVFRLRFGSLHGAQEIYVSLDRDDIEQLMVECQVALDREQNARRLIDAIVAKPPASEGDASHG